MAKLSGVLAPVLTPFDDELQPDPARFLRHCRRLLSRGCSALAVFGTTSEANSLTVDERARLLETLLAEGVPPAALLPGTGCCALPDTVRLTAQAAKAKCAGVLVLPPFYYKGLTEDGVFRSYAELIERTGDIKVYLYHIPQYSGVPLTLTLIERLLKAYPGVVAGMKDSSGDWANSEAALQAFAGQFDVFVGSEKLLLRNLRAGGVGCITASANVNAAAIARLYAQWRSPQADALQADLELVRAVLEHFPPLIAALKEILAHFDEDPAWRRVRPPLVELTQAQREVLLQGLSRADYAGP